MLDILSSISNIIYKIRTLFNNERGIIMARPVEPTPVLRGKDARRFEKKIKHGLKKPTKLISTPKLDRARELVRQHAIRGKERF